MDFIAQVLDCVNCGWHSIHINGFGNASEDPKSLSVIQFGDIADISVMILEVNLSFTRVALKYFKSDSF